MFLRKKKNQLRRSTAGGKGGKTEKNNYRPGRKDDRSRLAEKEIGPEGAIKQPASARKKKKRKKKGGVLRAGGRGGKAGLNGGVFSMKKRPEKKKEKGSVM